MTKLVKAHGCVSAFQDSQYGGRRVANLIPGKLKDAPRQWRCTVCGKVVDSGRAAKGKR